MRPLQSAVAEFCLSLSCLQVILVPWRRTNSLSLLINHSTNLLALDTWEALLGSRSKVQHLLSYSVWIRISGYRLDLDMTLIKSFQSAWVISHSLYLCICVPHPSMLSVCLVWIPRRKCEVHPLRSYIWVSLAHDFLYGWQLSAMQALSSMAHSKACCVPLLPISIKIPSPHTHCAIRSVSVLLLGCVLHWEHDLAWFRE